MSNTGICRDEMLHRRGGGKLMEPVSAGPKSRVIF